jgi:hypothetical protein
LGSSVSERSTPTVGRILYWFLGAPVVLLADMYTGTMPLVLLGPSEERAPIVNLAAAPYAALVCLASLYFAWSCWRAVRGEPPATAFRPFPWWVWAGAAAVGLASGAVAFVRAA